MTMDELFHKHVSVFPIYIGSHIIPRQYIQTTSTLLGQGIGIYICVCLSVTCPLRFCQNDLGLLYATVVTWGWNGYWNKSQHRKLSMEEKFIHCPCKGSNPRPSDHGSSASYATELYNPLGSSNQKSDIFKDASVKQMKLGCMVPAFPCSAPHLGSS